MKPLLLNLLHKHQAIQHGDFTLASGQKSNLYVDMRRLLCTPDGRFIGEAMAEMIWNALPDGDRKGYTIAGVADAGIALMQAVLSTKTAEYCDWTGGWVRKEPKGYGMAGIWAGSPLRAKIILVEDVITTGESVAKTIVKLHELIPNSVCLVAAILNRANNDNFGAIAGIDFNSILSLEDIQEESK